MKKAEFIPLTRGFGSLEVVFDLFKKKKKEVVFELRVIGSLRNILRLCDNFV